MPIPRPPAVAMGAECDPSVLWKKKAFVSVAVLLTVRLIEVHFLPVSRYYVITEQYTEQMINF